MASVLIAGDIYPGNLSAPLLIKGDTQAVFGDLLPIFEWSDLVVANLEGPLVSRSTPICKIGPIHSIQQDCINGLHAAGIDILNLSNLIFESEFRHRIGPSVEMETE